MVSSSLSSSLLLQLLLLLIGGTGTSTSSFGGPTFVEGWGTIGHEIVANIAWNRLGLSEHESSSEPSSSLSYHHHHHHHFDNNMNKIQSWIVNILNDTDDNNTDNNDDDPSLSPLAVVADWADRVRHYKPWSAPLHFIDVRDDLYQHGCHYHHHYHSHHYDSSSSSSSSSSSNITTTSKEKEKEKECYFDYQRDCPNNICVAGAIINYTKQLLILPDNDDTSTTKQQQSEEKMHNNLNLLLLRGSGSGSGNNGDNDDASSSSSSLDESSSSWLKSQALRFVVHFIGDIHQPLHSSRKTDKGGNDFHVHVDFISSSKKHNNNNNDNNAVDSSAPTRNTRNYHHHRGDDDDDDVLVSHHHSWNLHSVWDTGIIEVVMERDYNNSRQLFEEDLINESYDNIDKYAYYYNKECSIGMNQSCTTLWGQESFQLALQYAYLIPSSSSFDDNNTDTDESEEEEEVRNGSTLTENYYESRLPIVKQQLIAAGIRLATTLEAIYNATHNNINNNDIIMNGKNDEEIYADEDQQQQQQGQPALSILTNLRMGFAM